MRTILFLALTLPLWAQAPATQAPAGGEAPKGEGQPQAQAAPAPAQTPPTAESWLSGSLDIGYRFLTDVRGSFDTYRSVVNLGEGPKLFGADFTIQPPRGRFADRIDVNLTSWGGEPYNTARVNARKTGLYDFRFDYRNIAYFNFLPSFANPGRISPALPFLDQYGFDIFRRLGSFELDLFPGHKIIPYVAYERNGGRGDGLQNFVLQLNEYTVPTHYSDHTNQYRGGVRFEFSRWHATLEAGRSNFRDDQSLSQAASQNLGNLRTPFLGRTLFLTEGTQNYGIRGDAVFARGLFTANPVSWADIFAQFLFSQPKTDIHFTQTNTGQFINLGILMFYNSEVVDWTGTAKQPHPAGSVGFILKPFGGRLRVMESYSTDRLHTAGMAVLADQLLVTGQPPTPQSAAEAALYVANYHQQEVNLLFDVTSRVTVRVGDRYRWGDVTAPPSVTISGQGFDLEKGKLNQNIFLGGLTFRTATQFRLSVDLERAPGDRVFFRTSLNDYTRARVLGRWRPANSLELSARVNVLANRNPDPLVRYSYLNRDNAFSAYWNPTRWKGFGLLGEYDRSTVRSNIIYIIPSQLSPDLSRYRENAHIGTLLVDVPFAGGGHPPKLSFGGSFFRSTGSRPTRFYQPLARVSVPLGAHAQFNTEWRWYGMSEPYYLFEGFRSHQFITSLRLMR
jgi:hypothetical protein